MGNASSSAAPLLKSETSSSCVTQSGITAAHDFVVTDFSLLEAQAKDIGVRACVSSSKFRVGGCDWNICLYSNGNTEEYKHHVSAYLQLHLEGGGRHQEGVVAVFSFIALSKNGKAWKMESFQHTFKSSSLEVVEGFGSGRFLYKSRHFRKWLRNNDDGFTVRCVLTVIQGPSVTVVVPAPSVLGDMARMLKDGDGADVTFVVGERSFPAHRCILAARSAVFRAELFGPMKEKVARHVCVDDMEPSVFEALLHFVYTDSLPDDDDKADKNVPMMQHLLVGADRYGLDRLKAICEDRLCHAIDVETVATTLTLAEQHQCVQLKDDCLWFIAFRDVHGSITNTDGFKHLIASCPFLKKEIRIRQDLAGV